MQKRCSYSWDRLLHSRGLQCIGLWPLPWTKQKHWWSEGAIHLHYFTKTHGGCGYHLNSRPNACLSFLTKQNVSRGTQSSSDVTFIIGLRENIKGQQEMFVSERAINFNKLCFINRGSFKECCCSSCLLIFLFWEYLHQRHKIKTNSKTILYIFF